MANLKNVFTALILAIIIWFIVKERISVPSPEMKPVKVDIQVPEGYMVIYHENLEDPREKPEVWVRPKGPREVLDRINFDELVARPEIGEEDINPSDLGNRISISVKASDFPLPRDVDIVEIDPNMVTCTLSVKERKILKVKPNLKGEPAEGFEIRKDPGIIVEPNEVLVEGPKHVLDPRETIFTEEINIAGAKKDVITHMGLMRGEGIMANMLVKVSIPIGPKPVKKELSVKVGFLTHPDYPYKYEYIKGSDGTVKVTLWGPKPILEPITPDQIKAFIDLRDPAFKPQASPYTDKEVLLRLPPGVTVKEKVFFSFEIPPPPEKKEKTP
jgi:hypothetical protein